jgi:trimeric autotransporter adhesin
VVSSGTGVNAGVDALAVFDDGAGQALYLGGDFTQAGGFPADRVARWDGNDWSPIAGVQGHPNARVNSLAVVTEPTGRALYAGGFFPTAGGQTANNIAKFRSGAWSALVSASGAGLPNVVNTLARLTVDTTSYLVAGGPFPTAGGQTVNRVVVWDGATWVPLAGASGVGVSDYHAGFGSASVSTAVALDDDGGPALWVGGNFLSAGGLPAGQVGRLGCGPLFADGFETGDTSGWSATVP